MNTGLNEISGWWPHSHTMRMMPLNSVGTEAPLLVTSPDLCPRHFFIKMLNHVLYNILSLKLLSVSKDLFLSISHVCDKLPRALFHFFSFRYSCWWKFHYYLAYYGICLITGTEYISSAIPGIIMKNKILQNNSGYKDRPKKFGNLFTYLFTNPNMHLLSAY